MISVEDWAEIRRLHRGEGVPIKEIARRLGLARNTVRSALRSDEVPRRERGPRAKLADAVEPQVRALLAEWPKMPATVIAERIGWQYSMTTLKDRIRVIRPEYAGVDPVDRITYRPGEIAQCDLWFPAPTIPVGMGQQRMLPVLVMVLGHSRMITATMIPSRQAGDILAGMWALICRFGRVPKTLVWDREAAIGGTGKPSTAAMGFAGTLATRIVLAPPKDPEFKGLVERANGYLETSFLPGRIFGSPADFNAQLQVWLARANTRTVRAIGGRPVDLFETDYQGMIELPPVVPATGLTHRIRLARDYYVRIDANDYSIDPSVIGRFVDVNATATEVIARCDGRTVARHQRCWATHAVITDPEHRQTAAALRNRLADDRRRRAERRHHLDGHPVALRALPDYDALFGVEFDCTPTSERNSS
ncbi:IS21 family transposase [Mycobacteroides abscessus]|uniref:IS21 family transposase n=1 Tax=Mycobacteroides abscessus TaxID=36809 RepID=UPI000D698CC6|nr:IS21 family transposase [Mycobacteroides abscessus]